MLGELLILQAFEYRRKTWTKGNLRILSKRSCGHERSSRGRLGNLMERDRGGQETEATGRHAAWVPETRIPTEGPEGLKVRRF